MKNIFKPMLYSAPMVQGIFENIKNQTRRTKGLEKINENPDNWRFSRIIDAHAKFIGTRDPTIGKHIKCPWSESDIIWVRENLYQNGEMGLEYSANGEAIDEEIIPVDYGPYGGKYTFRIIPGIHMPKWACRIFLKVIDVRVERLNEITVWSAESEGVEVRSIDGDVEYRNYLADGVTTDEPWGDSYFPNNPLLSFMSLWKKINGEESWELNPWVWVIKFERIEKPLDFT